MAKDALEKQEYGEYYNEQVFETAIEQMIQKDDNNPDGNIKKRQMAEILNYVVF